MNRRLVALVAAFVLLVSGATPGMARVSAPNPDAGPAPAPAAAPSLPASPVDETKVPHYFGPYPNWANSPLTAPDATVTITGDGTGATAVATVGANGAVTGITITNPGSGYTSATVDITSANGTGASASAVVTASSAVTAVNVTAPGSGYRAPTVAFSGGGSTKLPVTVAGVTPTATDTFAVTAGSATGGSFTLVVDGGTPIGPIPFPATAADIDGALLAAGFTTTTTGTGMVADPWVIVFGTAPAIGVAIDATGLTRGVADTSSTKGATPGTWTVSAGSATGGSFILTVDTVSTAAIPFPATAGAVDAALSAVGFTTSTTGSGLWDIVFATAPASVTIDGAALTRGVTDAGVTPNATRLFSLAVGSADGGTYALVLDGRPTAPIAWNATAGGIQAALPVGTTVTGTGPFAIKLSAAPASFTVDRTQLTETASTPSAQATGTAYGGVDVVTIGVQGEGYHFPTVDFDLPDDPNGVQAQGHALCDSAHPSCQAASDTDVMSVIGVVVDSPGSGYATAPGVSVRDGTQFDPVNHGTDPFTEATATATLAIQSVVVETFGSGYTSVPTVTFGDATGTGTGASATAVTAVGSVTGLTLQSPGSGYITPGGIKKFQDTLPGLNEAGKNNLGQYIPLAQPDTTTFPGTDYYVIAVVQHRERMSSSLPAAGTLLREYVQLSTSVVPGKSVPLMQDNLVGASTQVLMPDGTQALGVDDPHYLGPTIVAQKDRAVRIVFYNLLPKGEAGDLFLPSDSSLMGAGDGPGAMGGPVNDNSVTDQVRNPVCSNKRVTGLDPTDCYTENRATLHLHGGVTPWISDGTPHQWITPANEATPYPQGVSVQNVPDMVGTSAPAGVPDCNAANDGCQTFYYTNQQSARLMFYHDHAWGITRLNVYAGEAAGYVITDKTEQRLFGPSGTYKDMGEGIPLVIQDRTFVPSADQLAGQDPTWDASKWGGYGNLWYHHVYMPAQNPGDPSGMSAYGRWMYGPWFWPPATPQYGPIANPYFGKDPATSFTTPLAKPCSLDDPSTWQYKVDPFCEPEMIPGTPNVSVGMEQFNDTPIVNGTAYPTTTLQPKSYRFRVLNAANDRFWNLSWYVADSTGTEVALKASEVAAAQTDVNVFPTPDETLSPKGPDWIQIASEGGFLPAPAVVPAQPTTWITDPTRFDVGNVDKHSLLLAPAERGDVIVDFSRYAGKTLILYNDAPAAFPARVGGYDYYTGGPDTGAGVVLPGYGPNTRTIMQVKIDAVPAATAFNVTALRNLFTHKANGTGVFEEGQHPIIVGQAAYNSAYGKTFAGSGDCTSPTGTNRCDGFARINQQGGDLFRFDNLKGSSPQLKIPLQPKALHDEMNSAAFDEFGRMTANLGLEAVPATPALQNIMLYPYIAPPTEVIDGTNLPKGDVNVQAISDAKDGTQIWKITHNGVDTHPIHFHLYDVQVLNRVTWDNIIIPTEASELGWKDTVRVSPLEDTIVALRPIIPTLPFEIPNSIRPLSPMMPVGANLDPNGVIVDPKGNVTTVSNALVNYGWEYVYHCHILSHEEMDMMRPVLLALPPKAADGLGYTVTGNGANTRLALTWKDNSSTETSYLVQRQAGTNGWTTIGTLAPPLSTAPNTSGGTLSFVDTTFRWNSTVYSYRVVARNTVGAVGAGFANYPVVNADAASAAIAAVRAPSNLVATLLAGPQVRLTWTDNAANESGFIVQRSSDGGTTFASLLPNPGANATSFIDAGVIMGATYIYRVAATSAGGPSAWSNVVPMTVSLPSAPSSVTAAPGPNQGSSRSVILTWVDTSNNESGFVVQRATNAAFTTGVVNTNVAANATGATITGLTRNVTYWFQVASTNALGSSAQVASSPASILTNP
jgi:FtsP/CotA-like multicopper oxidase with cupredoxin domain